MNAVVGVTGSFNDKGGLHSIGIQCSFCHSTVDYSFAPGIGHRLNGRANRDLNVGAIVALSPNLQPVADLLEVDVPTVRKILNSWGPGKFDAERFLERLRRQPGNARTKYVFRSPAERRQAISRRRWLCKRAEQSGHDYVETRRARVLPARDPGAEVVPIGKSLQYGGAPR